MSTRTRRPQFFLKNTGLQLSFSRSLVMLLLSAFSLGSLSSCGLPSITDSELEPSRPVLSSYYNPKTAEVVITLSGYYPSSTFDKFNGFNLYFNIGNSTTSDIFKRIIYLSDSNQLPSKTAYDISTSIDIILTNDFDFRLTGTNIDEQDLIHEKDNFNSAKQLYTKDIKSGDTFYFIARPVSDYQEYSYSETLELRIPIVNTQDVTLTATGTTYTLNDNDRDFKFTITRKDEDFAIDFAIEAVEIDGSTDIIRGQQFYQPDIISGCYASSAIPADRTQLSTNKLPLLLLNQYTFFIDNSDLQYRVYVMSQTGDSLDLCTALEIPLDT